MLCRVLGVQRSGYYKWLASRMVRQQKRDVLLNRIIEVFEESGETYGSPRIFRQLKREGFGCSKETVERLMHQHEIKPRRKRRFKSTTDSNHSDRVAPNRLNREFNVGSPNEVWVSDITYIETSQGWLYLCVFIDLYSRMVVGWSMSAYLNADLAVRAFQMGVRRRGAPKMVHSDRGTQYASRQFRKELIIHRCLRSMSRKANCWDNAVSESFFGSLKSELVHRTNFDSREEAQVNVFNYIEIFYNIRRLHSALGYLTPWEKEQKGRKVA